MGGVEDFYIIFNIYHLQRTSYLRHLIFNFFITLLLLAK